MTLKGKVLTPRNSPERPPAEARLVPLAEDGKKRYTVAVDFDGVLHSYMTPWVTSDVIPDGPVEGAVQWYNEISQDFDIVIHTTRARTPQGRVAVHRWLDEHGFFQPNGVTHEKIPALIYIDDRGWRFTGDNFPTREQIHAARPWNKEGARRRAGEDEVPAPSLNPEGLAELDDFLALPEWKRRDWTERQEAFREGIEQAREWLVSTPSEEAENDGE